MPFADPESSMNYDVRAQISILCTLRARTAQAQTSQIPVTHWFACEIEDAHFHASVPYNPKFAQLGARSVQHWVVDGSTLAANAQQATFAAKIVSWHRVQ